MKKILLAGVLLSLSGCNLDEILNNPDCGSQVTTDIVADIIRDPQNDWMKEYREEKALQKLSQQEQFQVGFKVGLFGGGVSDWLPSKFSSKSTWWQGIQENLDVDVINVVPLSKNKENLAVTCKANVRLNVKVRDNQFINDKTYPVHYTVEKTSSGEFWVEVTGE